jgi:hypothetical protein
MKWLLILVILIACPCFAQTPACGLEADGSNKVPPDWATFTAPAKGASYTDATFGCQVTRLTSGSADFAGTQYAVEEYYSTVTSITSDDALIWVMRDDGSSYIIQNPLVTGQNGTAVPIANMPTTGGRTIQWDRNTGNLFYYINNTDNVLRSGTVTGRPSCLTGGTCTVTSVVVHAFSEYALVGMMDETRESIDGCHLVMEGQVSAGTAIDVFTWDSCTNTKSMPYTTSCTGNVTDNNDACLHKIQIAGDNSIFYLLETANVENLWNGTTSICEQGDCSAGAVGTEHGDAGLDLYGSSVWISGADRDVYGSGQPNPCPYTSYYGLSKILANTPTTGLVCLWDFNPSGLPSGPGGGGWHVGYGGSPTMPWATISWFDISPAEYFGNNGSYAAPTSANWPTYNGEIDYVNIGTTQSGSTNGNSGVYRLAYARSRTEEGFFAQVLANSSFDGKYIVFNSNMAYGNGGCTGNWHVANECEDVYLLSGPNGTPLLQNAVVPGPPTIMQAATR